MCVRLLFFHMNTQTVTAKNARMMVLRGPGAHPLMCKFSPDNAFLRSGRHKAGFWAVYRSGCAAGCCPEDGGSSPLGRQAEEDYEEEMRFRQTAVPVTERAAAGVLCLVPCFLFSPVDIPDTIKAKT